MDNGHSTVVRKYPFLPPDPRQGWLPYMWLIYLFPFALPAVFSHGSPREWLLTALGIALFLPLYFLGYWVQGRAQMALALAMTALALAYARWNFGASCFVVFAVAALAHDENALRAWRNIAIVLGLTLGASWVFHFNAWFWGWSLFGLFLAAVLMETNKRHALGARLSLAHEEIARLARIAERERIARDLHDVLGHTLSVIVLKSELASKLTGTNPERAAKEIHEVEGIARDALSQVRATVAGYRLAGLDSELDHARDALRTAGIEFLLEVEPVVVSPAQETVLAMAIREAITNVVRHAEARSCRLALRKGQRGCELEVVDDGRGSTAPEGFGISGMRERVEALGGTLERNGAHGMRLILRLPAGEAQGAT